jgi:biotin operon repressor
MKRRNSTELLIENEMESTKRIINFIKLAEVIRNPRLKPVQKALLVDLLLYAGTSGDAFPSQDTLAKDLGCSSRYIRMCLDMLTAAGLIVRKRRGFSKSNLYLINKELYFRNDINKITSISSHPGTDIPNYSSTSLPSNVTQLNNSNKDLSEPEKEQIEKRKQEIRDKYPFLKGSSRK